MLAQRNNLENLVRAFQQAEKEVRECYARLHEAEKNLNISFGITPDSYDSLTLPVDPLRGGSCKYLSAEKTLQHARTRAWFVLIERMELRRIMSNAAYEELRKQAHNDPPPITMESVQGFINMYATNLPDIFKEAVNEVFEYLRPARTKYKTNTQYAVGKRVVLTRIVQQDSHNYKYSKFYVEQTAIQPLITLENVFYGLDGQGTIAKNHVSKLQLAIEACPRDVGKGETDLFRFAVFGNGSCHLTFKRLDLLAKFNQIAGGKRLVQKEEKK